MNLSYNKGLHKLMTLKVNSINSLLDSKSFKDKSEFIFKELSLTCVGYSSYSFDNKSFTAAFCLKESHICIHTWPEFNLLTLDIYLCNFLQDNSEKVNLIAEKYIEYFDAKIINNHDILR